MDEKEFVAFFMRFMLKEHFGNKRAMARALGMQLRTLQINFQNLDTAKGGIIAFEKLILYCCQNKIDLEPIYRKYIDSSTKDEAVVCIEDPLMNKSSLICTMTAFRQAL